jgi:hypothetical protein
LSDTFIGGHRINYNGTELTRQGIL